jgi:histone acetyltransferase 1
VKQLVNRIQICVLFYIEGGSFIGKDADGNDEPDYSLARWTVYFLYKKQAGVEGPSKYIFQGYSTVYDFWHFELPTPPASPGNEPIQAKVNHDWELPAGDMSYTDMPHRARISQFVILPPFQGKGAGAMLYNTIFELQSKDTTTKEITVEDPNEAFDLLRDLCDLKYLRKNVPEFANMSINPDIKVPMRGGILRHNLQVTHGIETSPKGIVDIDALEALRVRVKIAPRQFSRLVEMYLMSKLPPSVRPLGMSSEGSAKTGKPTKDDKKIYTLWRLLVKQRVYRRNATLLEEFEITERIIKLNDTIDNIEFEYANILERLDAPRPGTVVEDDETAGTKSSAKRKPEDEANGQQARKKLKAQVEDA